MRHIDLKTHEEVVQRFFLALPLDPDGSLIELDGQAVAHVHRVENESAGAEIKQPQ